MQKGFDVQALPKNLRADFALTLQQRASLTWQELQRADRHGQGYELIPAAQFRAPIPDAFSDVEKFMVFRYSAKLPMAGHRVGDVFHLLWLEAKFNDLYPH